MANLATPELMIDTDIIVDYLRRRSRTLEIALSQFACGMTAITWYELEAIPSHSGRQMELLRRLATVMPVLPFDIVAAAESAEIWRELRASGMGIGLPDTLIAGVCRANGLPLLTKNEAHFSRVDGLRVIAPRILDRFSAE